MVKIVIGLGNPGEKYAKTRHNIGFEIIDAIAERYSFPSYSSKFQGQYTVSKIKGQKIILLKPQTFMNLSGRSVQECVNFYKISLEDVIVIHDELDLELGRIKIKVGGSNAGHNGLKSLDECIGNGYTRLRFGIDRPDMQDVSSYVLSNFAKDEFEFLPKVIEEIIVNFTDLMKGDYQGFLNKYAVALKPFKEKD